MKKAVLKILVVIMAVCAMLCAFTACEDNNAADAPIHKHSFVDFTVNPTCAAAGYTLHKCACGEEYKDNFTDALSHNYINGKCALCGAADPNYVEPVEECTHDYAWTTVKEPTETQEGVKSGVCKKCGDTITQTIPTLSHEHNYIITVKAPTCTTNGYTLHKCLCGEEYKTDEKAALGHTSAEAIEENRIKATCTEDGSYDSVIYCSICHTEILRENKIIPATGHEFTHYVSDGNATYESDGTKTAYCNNGCGAKDTIPDIGSKLVHTGIKFNSLSTNGTNVNGKVPNEQTTFSFLTEISVSGNATFSVSYDINGNNKIPNKTVNLSVGDNVFYVLEEVNGNASNLFTVTVRRRPIYTVSFNTNGGVAVASRQIEEDDYTEEPTTTKAGYTFTGWDYDFDSPITKDTTINASWTANTNTPYKVEYYLQNLIDNNYTRYEIEDKTGTTDTTANAEIKEYEHFTHTTISESKESGNINADGSTILKVYYTRNKYTIKLLAGDNVTVDNPYDGTYKYGYTIDKITANYNERYLGYEWKGWHNGDDVLTYDNTIQSFTVDKDMIYTADFPLKPEMLNYDFTSDAETCVITGVKDKTVTEIVIPNYITHIDGGVFPNCNSLVSVCYTGDIASWCGIDFEASTSSPFWNGANFYINNQLITSIVVPSTITSINSYAFYRCNSLINITIPDSVTSIGDSAFYCPSLTSVYYTGSIADWCSIMFENCNSTPICNRYSNLYINNQILTSLVIPNTVTTINAYAFYGCKSLISIKIPDSVTYIGNGAFSGCGSIISVYYDGDEADWCNINYGNDTAHPLYYGADLYINNKLLTNLIIPNTVTDINAYTFHGCESLKTVIIPNSVTTIGECAFSSCGSLTSITIGNSVTSIEWGAFSGCNGLISVTIGNNVTNIGSYVFSNCINLTDVVIGDGMKSIGGNAFNYSNLKRVYYTGTVEDWAKIEIDSQNSYLSSATRYYYSETEPAVGGNYWHYAPDGITPVIWVKEN